MVPSRTCTMSEMGGGQESDKGDRMSSDVRTW